MQGTAHCHSLLMFAFAFVLVRAISDASILCTWKQDEYLTESSTSNTRLGRITSTTTDTCIGRYVIDCAMGVLGGGWEVQVPRGKR